MWKERPEECAVVDGRALTTTVRRLCLERLRFYSIMEEESLRIPERSEEWRTTVTASMKTHLADFHGLCVEDDDVSSFRRKRALRHEALARSFVCLAVAREPTPDTVRWFVRNELRLFGFYFSRLSQRRKIDYLSETLSFRTVKDDTGVRGFKVHWKRALSLVRRRSVPVTRGEVSAGPEHLDTVARDVTPERISSLLNLFRERSPFLSTDTRIHRLLTELDETVRRHIRGVSKPAGTLDRLRISLNDLDHLSEGFPPCMRRIYEHVETHHHIRYHARLQVVPFLKEVGLTVEDALRYFEDRFTQNISPGEYKNKRYQYFIRYLYGLEGKKVESECLNCSQIKSVSHARSKDCHGCPLLTTQSLRQTLASPSYEFMSQKDKESVVQQLGKIPTGALCAKILELKFPKVKMGRNTISNPVQYFSMYHKFIIDSQCTESSESTSE